MTANTRLIEASRAVIAAEDMPRPKREMNGSEWLRWEADKLESRETALKDLREALKEIDVIEKLGKGEDAA